MSSWDKKLNSVTTVERGFALHPDSTNAAAACRYISPDFVNLPVMSMSPPSKPDPRYNDL